MLKNIALTELVAKGEANMGGLHFVFLIEHKTILLILWVTRQRNSELNLVFLFIDRRAENDKKKVCYFVQT